MLTCERSAFLNTKSRQTSGISYHVGILPKQTETIPMGSVIYIIARHQCGFRFRQLQRGTISTRFGHPCAEAGPLGLIKPSCSKLL